MKTTTRKTVEPVATTATSRLMQRDSLLLQLHVETNRLNANTGRLEMISACAGTDARHPQIHDRKSHDPCAIVTFSKHNCSTGVR